MIFKQDIITSNIQIILQVFVSGQSYEIIHPDQLCPIGLSAILETFYICTAYRGLLSTWNVAHGTEELVFKSYVIQPI